MNICLIIVFIMILVIILNISIFNCKKIENFSINTNQESINNKIQNAITTTNYAESQLNAIKNAAQKTLQQTTQDLDTQLSNIQLNATQLIEQNYLNLQTQVTIVQLSVEQIKSQLVTQLYEIQNQVALAENQAAQQTALTIVKQSQDLVTQLISDLETAKTNSLLLYNNVISAQTILDDTKKQAEEDLNANNASLSTIQEFNLLIQEQQIAIDDLQTQSTLVDQQVVILTNELIKAQEILAQIKKTYESIIVLS